MHHPFPLNDHAWYTLATGWDYVRMILTVASNLAIAYAYFAIPYEILQWYRATRFVFVLMLSAGFIGFISYCGLHHVKDIIIMPTQPWWGLIGFDLPLAIYSILVAETLRRFRPRIVALLTANAEAIRAAGLH
jgi:hypothetical protein